jgi:hypothetical protein
MSLKRHREPWAPGRRQTGGTTVSRGELGDQMGAVHGFLYAVALATTSSYRTILNVADDDCCSTVQWQRIVWRWGIDQQDMSVSLSDQQHMRRSHTSEWQRICLSDLIGCNSPTVADAHCVGLRRGIFRGGLALTTARLVTGTRLLHGRTTSAQRGTAKPVVNPMKHQQTAHALRPDTAFILQSSGQGYYTTKVQTVTCPTC